MNPLRAVWCCLLVAAFAAAPAFAADEAKVLTTRAARLAEAGECADAVATARRARALAPADADAALVEGSCLVTGKRYAEAIEPLEEALRLRPDSGEAALGLGIARYHTGDLAGAEAALERADAQLPESAEVSLYTGLVLLEQQRDAEAAARLQRAASLDNAEVGSLSTYYAGLAHANAGDRERAERELRRAQELAPGSPWAERAEEALAPEPLRRWLVLRAGVDYDDNVALRGDRVAQPSNISDDEDFRGWWGVDAGAELFRKDGWSGGIQGRYTGASYFRENDFDEHFGGVSPWVDRALGERTTLRVQGDFGGGFVDRERFLRFYGGGLDLLHRWGRPGTGTLYTRYHYNEYLYNVRGPFALRTARNRDGHAIRAGYDHAVAVGPSTELRGGPFLRRYIAEGSEYDHRGYGGWIGVGQQLPWRFRFDASASLAHDDYDDPSTFRLPGELEGDREDLITTLSATLRRPIVEHVTLGARWLYYHSDSNTRVFDYERHIVGVFVEVAFGN